MITNRKIVKNVFECIDETDSGIISHRDLAKQLGIKPKKMLSTIDERIESLVEVGEVYSKETMPGNTVKRELFLDLHASSLLISEAKNNKKGVEMKVMLCKEMRRAGVKLF